MGKQKLKLSQICNMMVILNFNTLAEQNKMLIHYDKTSCMTVGTRLTVVPTKSDSDVIFCLNLLSKTLTLHSTSAIANR